MAVPSRFCTLTAIFPSTLLDNNPHPIRVTQPLIAKFFYPSSFRRGHGQLRLNTSTANETQSFAVRWRSPLVQARSGHLSKQASPFPWIQSEDRPAGFSFMADLTSSANQRFHSQIQASVLVICCSGSFLTFEAEMSPATALWVRLACPPPPRGMIDEQF